MPHQARDGLPILSRLTRMQYERGGDPDGQRQRQRGIGMPFPRQQGQADTAKRGDERQRPKFAGNVFYIRRASIA